MTFEFETYAQNMMQKHQKKIDSVVKSKSGILIHCKSCSNLSFILYRDQTKKCECVVCEETISKESFLKNIRESESRQINEEISFLTDYEEYNYNCENCNNQSRVIYKPSYFLANTNNYQPDYFFCVNCIDYETQLQINSRELDKELKELEKNHSPEEFIEILKSKIKHLDEGEEKKTDEYNKYT